MSKPVVVGLDRDGTINVDKGYIKRPEDFEAIPGSLQAIKLLRDRGYDVVILSNQAGISQGIMSSVEVDSVNYEMLVQLGKIGCRSINALFYSTSNLKDDPYAKPNTGMFERAENETGVNFKNGYFVGDKITDLKAAVKAKAMPVLVLTGHGQETLKKLDSYANKDLKKQTKIYDNLLAFVNTLVN